MMFLYRYSLAIGWPVQILKKIMTSRDISEAMAFESIHPFGELRSDYRAAMISHTIAASKGMKKKDGTKLSINDFMPDFGAKEKSVSDKIKEVFRKWRH